MIYQLSYCLIITISNIKLDFSFIHIHVLSSHQSICVVQLLKTIVHSAFILVSNYLACYVKTRYVFVTALLLIAVYSTQFHYR